MRSFKEPCISYAYAPMTNTQTMIQGDCLDLMMGMPDAAFDAIITDPLILAAVR